MTKQEFIQWARQVGPQYRFNEKVAAQLANVELVALVGPTGAGKTTLMDKLGIHIVKSDVTRNRRADERRNDTYNFRDDYDALAAQISAGEFVQFIVREYDEFYGTLASSFPSSGRCTMAIIANTIPLFEKFGFKKVVKVYIMPPGYVEWLHRIGSVRSDDIDQRLEEAKTSLKLAMKDDEYSFVLNDDIDLAVKDVQKILAGEPIQEHREQLARSTANVLLKHLGDQEDDDIYL